MAGDALQAVRGDKGRVGVTGPALRAFGYAGDGRVGSGGRVGPGGGVGPDGRVGLASLHRLVGLPRGVSLLRLMKLLRRGVVLRLIRPIGWTILLRRVSQIRRVVLL